MGPEIPRDSNIKRELGAIASELANIKTRLDEARKDRQAIFTRLDQIHVEASKTAAGHESRILLLERLQAASQEHPRCEMVIQHEQQIRAIEQWRSGLWKGVTSAAAAIAAFISAAVLAVSHFLLKR